MLRIFRARFFQFITAVLLFNSTTAFAITPESYLRGDLHSVTTDGRALTQDESLGRLLTLGLNLNEDYQIGGEWGKKPVNQGDLKDNTHFRRMALSTAKVRSATGFYLGEFNGKYVMASNHHVCPTDDSCMGKGAIYFPLLNIRTQITEFYGTWPEIDLSLFAIQLTSEQAQELIMVASPFAFESKIYHGQLLVTMGFGVADNSKRVLMANQDSDCKVFSADNEYRLMADPDDFNPGPYKAWSFANGCDVSHGDSGSAMMDRLTGEVVGIIWTGRIPKNEKVQNSQFMEQIFNHPTEDVWKELSYSVPAISMKNHLTDLLNEGHIPNQYRKTMRSILGLK